MAKYKIVLNDDLPLVAEVNRQLQETKGYCPCALEWNADTKCICTTFRNSLVKGEETECACGKYKIIKITEQND
jgi:hypothetical protein